MKVIWTVRSATSVNISITGNLANNGLSLGAFGYNFTFTPGAITTQYALTAGYTTTNAGNFMSVFGLTFVKS